MKYKVNGKVQFKANSLDDGKIVGFEDFRFFAQKPIKIPTIAKIHQGK